MAWDKLKVLFVFKAKPLFVVQLFLKQQKFPWSEMSILRFKENC